MCGRFSDLGLELFEVVVIVLEQRIGLVSSVAGPCLRMIAKISSRNQNSSILSLATETQSGVEALIHLGLR
jgi:hypothetical protein